MDAGDTLPTALPLPDFVLLADTLTLAGEHVRRVDNLPAVDTEPLTNLLAVVNRRQINFEVELRATIEAQFVSLRRRMDLFVLGEAQALEPLWSLVTGDVIPEFPATLLAIDVLPAPQVNAILVHLEEDQLEEDQENLEEDQDTKVTRGRKKLERAVGVVMRHR
ncbi:hypothetical protein E4U13_000410 [Claviceps humidiphila]|uniref:Uncharacterized protein n=1 Tax=Claviceps humidiphila TaxID=1294629 RepID=A0A9P7Q947_9HYPO|nr:hypothetical protein E4U13_000410 [Claviceps humidiphila]